MASEGNERRTYLHLAELQELIRLELNRASQVEVGLSGSKSERFSKIRNEKRRQELIQKAAKMNQETRERLRELLMKEQKSRQFSGEVILSEKEENELKELKMKLLTAEFKLSNLLQNNALVQKILAA